jgi:hypothetical protein
MKTELKNKKFIVVDLYSGRNSEEETKHEVFNLSPNPYDGRYYGYCPRTDTINFEKLDVEETDEKVDDVLVIYVQKVKGESNREIIAFCDNATVHRKGIENPLLQRWIYKDGKYIRCTYSVESDYMYDLRDLEEGERFIIKVANYSSDMFHPQRFYKGKYPELDKMIIAYLENYLEEKEIEDDAAFQEKIQRVDLTKGGRLKDTSSIEPDYSSGGGGEIVKKNSRISKQALDSADYKCAAGIEHKTFKTSRGVPYMEGHHLIPCTPSNAKYYWGKQNKNIDCEENVVCLCPTCHRRIHFGDKEEKMAIIKQLYEIQEPKLKRAGITITLQELLDLYIE